MSVGGIVSNVGKADRPRGLTEQKFETVVFRIKRAGTPPPPPCPSCAIDRTMPGEEKDRGPIWSVPTFAPLRDTCLIIVAIYF